MQTLQIPKSKFSETDISDSQKRSKGQLQLENFKAVKGGAGLQLRQVVDTGADFLFIFQ